MTRNAEKCKGLMIGPPECHLVQEGAGVIVYVMREKGEGGCVCLYVCVRARACACVRKDAIVYLVSDMCQCDSMKELHKIVSSQMETSL